jgi:hypothetical protein
MTTLTDFGVDTPDQATQATSTGRCEAIVIDDGPRRCYNNPNTGSSLCTAHRDTQNTVTIRDGPYEIITKLFQRAGKCRAVQGDGAQCSNTTYPFDRTCGIHSPADNYKLVAPDGTDLNQALIANALRHVSEEYPSTS